jgi:hypothetical protein
MIARNAKTRPRGFYAAAAALPVTEVTPPAAFRAGSTGRHRRRPTIEKARNIIDLPAFRRSPEVFIQNIFSWFR